MKNKKIFFLLSALLLLAGSLCAQQPQPILMGMTQIGGNGAGVIFGMPTGSATLSMQTKIEVINPGINPMYTRLMEATNGKLYGVMGGGADDGVLYEYDPADNSYIVKMPFLDTLNSQGFGPAGSLMQAANGKLYGTAIGGGSGVGVLFEYDLATNSYARKVNFLGTANGKSPVGALLQAGNGLLYGLTSEGGIYDNGTLYEYNTATGTLTKKIDFDDTNTGRAPKGSLVQAGNGKLYGLTSSGGAFSYGVLFEYDPVTGVCTKKVDFNGSGNGAVPYGALAEGSNGLLYGLTPYGGVNGMGVLFEYDPVANTNAVKINFDGALHGSYPEGTLTLANNGLLYGMTAGGGVNDLGSLFEYDPAAGACTKKFDFDGAANGSVPLGSLLQASNSKLYGLTFHGGATDEGVLFEYGIAGSSYTKKLELNRTPNGRRPQGALMQASGGMLYGLTMEGGNNQLGVLFSYDPLTMTYTKKLDMDGINTGSHPWGSLMEASNGLLYGMTKEGGVNNKGILFTYEPATNTCTKKMDFDGAMTGSDPFGALMQASNGKLYGMTAGGGTNNMGVLFEYDPVTDIYTKRLDFNGTANGAGPLGALTEAPNGKLYGMTQQGGTNNMGVLFEFDPVSGSCIKKQDFNSFSAYPGGTLCLANNGRLYGVGTGGHLFEFDPATSTYTPKINLNTSVGVTPTGSLMRAHDGKLYGLTRGGGLHDMGTVFQYDPVGNTRITKLSFNSLNGLNPTLTQLIEIRVCNISATATHTDVSCNGVSDGSATIIAAGGTGTLIYDWAPGTLTGNDTITGLSAQQYTCIVSDIYGCKDTATVSISGPPPTGSAITTSACRMFTLNGQTYTGSGIYTQQLVSMSGCDSILTLNLTIDTVSLYVTQAGATLTAGQAAAAYQWLDCMNGNAPIAGATGQSFTPTVNGTYAVVISSGSCSDTSACMIVSNVGVPSYEEEGMLNVYPNPSAGIYIVELRRDAIITVTNTLGAVVKKEELNAGTAKIDLSNEANGVYFMQLTSKGSMQTIKLVKQD